MISKPMVPPFDDSAKNIVLTQLRYSSEFHYRVLGSRGSKAPAPGVAVDPIYPDSGAYSPGLKQNLRVMLHGLRPRGASLYHYFFAPNRVSSLAGRMQQLVARVRSVQTVCSRPFSFEGIEKHLFTDRVIVLSEDTRQKMMGAGVNAKTLRYVPPGIEPLDRASESERRAIRRAHGVPEDEPVVLFPGDFEFSSAARTVAQAVPLLAKLRPNAKVVFACRIKREASKKIRDEIKSEIDTLGLSDRVLFLERVDRMPAFAGAADVVVMPSESLFAKMDVPLVLLEAMSQGVPLVLANVPPLSELLSFECGLGAPPKDSAALAEAVAGILDDQGLGRRLALAGAEAVRTAFSAKAMARQVEQIYNEVLES
jgi:glycosyltransferase involved in cell wall biosynthesis